MNIVVIGCGAMGSIYTALLAADGHDVRVIDTNQAHVAAINRHGLHVWGASGDRTVRVPAYTSPPQCKADLVVCAVKARYVAAAVGSIPALLQPDSAVLTIQNGLGSDEVVAQAIGRERLIVGVAQGFGAAMTAPGHVHHNDMKAIRMGALNPSQQVRAREIARLWSHAGFDADAVEDITAMQWDKLICNVAYSAPCTLTGLTVGGVLRNEEASAVSRAAATEAFDVARARGIRLSIDDPVEAVQTFGARMPDAKPSVMLDVEAGRHSEVDVINGAIPREAARAGREAPINATLTALVRALETR